MTRVDTRAQLTVAGLVVTGGYGLLDALVLLSSGSSLPLKGVGAVLFLLTGGLWLNWQTAARERLQDAGSVLEWNVFWAFAGWIIPLVNLYVPLGVTREISRPHTTPFALWATLWTAYQIADLIDSYVWRGNPTLMASTGGLEALAAGAAIWLILRATASLPAPAEPVTPPRPVGTAH